MKAIIWTKYGSPDVLHLEEIEKPTPKDNEVLIRIYATTVTAGDCEVRGLKLPLLLRLPMRLYVGFRKPERITILGQELAGEIEAVGKDVNKFRKGDQVFAATSLGLGAYAEYKCMPEEPKMGVLVTKPINMTYEEAAAVPAGGLEALHFLKQGDIQRGQKVLINGAGGSIGTIAVQLAKYFGAEVTGVDSMGKLDMLRAIGADQVIDYTQADFTKSGETYDVIFDVVGKSSFSRSIRSLKQNGRYLLGNSVLSQVIRGRWASMTSSKKVIGGTSSDHVPRGEDDDPRLWAKLTFSQAPGQRRANVHIRINGNPNQRYALLFRDYLRAHPNSARSVELIKRELVKRHAEDEDAYYDIKDPVYDLIWDAAQDWARQTGWIPI